MRWIVHGERSLYESDWVNLRLVDVEIPGQERFEHHVVRMPHPAAGAVVYNEDRGLLLLWRIPDAPFSTPIQLSGNVLHLSLALLQLLLAAGVILAAALTYHWVKRFSPLYESLLLKANFGVVICCALLSFFAPLFLPLGLLLLLAGSLVVLRMERVS